MGRRLAHRGPDGWGFAKWGPQRGLSVSGDADALAPGFVGVAHRRLAILDLSNAAAQPMASPDGRLTMVYNGEVYNYLELRAQLEPTWPFKSHGDTEVLLAAYDKWGIGCLNRFVGMFAFAILDTRAVAQPFQAVPAQAGKPVPPPRLILARDFFGIKPLYYTATEKLFAFASEIGALLDLPGVSRNVNPQRLMDYLRFGHTDFDDQTMFASIHQLPPAHYLEIPLDAPAGTAIPAPVRYWELSSQRRKKSDISFAQAAAALREQFLANVNLHLRSDVPVGACLSGGIDSSSILAAARAHVGWAGARTSDAVCRKSEVLPTPPTLHAFSYIADDDRLNEGKWIDIAAAGTGATLHKTLATRQEFLADLERLIAAQGEPFAGTSVYAQHRVFQLAGEAGVKVLLDGQGADELLGGYLPYFRAATLLREGRLADAWRFAKRAAAVDGVGTGAAGAIFARAMGLVAPDWLHGLARRSKSPRWLSGRWFAKQGAVPMNERPSKGEKDLLISKLRQDVSRLSLPALLRYEDRNSMAFSIESRVPFLTPRFAELALSLPEDYLVSDGALTKSVFRAAMEGITPAPILQRRDKIGFATPQDNWLLAMRGWVDGVLLDPAAKAIGAIDIQAAMTAWNAIKRRNTTVDPCVWRWINVILWAKQLNVSFE
jgi:asparagine synthase (glutamine-hydrolysing)